MSRTLHIFDMMPFIHAGKLNKYSRLEQLVPDGATWHTQYTPTGGVSWLLKHIYPACQNGDVLVATDRKPTIKLDMLPSYKQHREHDENVRITQGAAEYILQQCEIPLIARAGYEADDIIYSAVKKYYDLYDQIYVYTGDSDLYFLVDDKVSIRPSSKNAKTVTRDNYEKVAKKEGMKYNCMTVYKIITGDTSDGIPALPKDQQLEYANKMYQDAFFEHLGDKEFVRYWTGILCPWALPQVDLVFPLDVDGLPDELGVPNLRMLINFGDAVNADIFRGRAEVSFDIKPYIIEMHDRGLYVDE